MGANTFVEVSNMEARTFFEVEKVGTRIILVSEIGGLVVLYDQSAYNFQKF